MLLGPVRIHRKRLAAMTYLNQSMLFLAAIPQIWYLNAEQVQPLPEAH